MLQTAPQIKKFVTEFLIIVLGVFVALAMETWWSEREDRSLDKNIRADMLNEFSANITILESDIQSNESAIAHFRFLPALSQNELLELSDDTLRDGYSGFHDWDGFDPHMGVAQALVNSGNLSQIHDRELRLRLARWSGLIRENNRKQLQAVDYQLISLLTVLSDAAADDEWTAEERRKMQIVLDSMAAAVLNVVRSQRALLVEAKQIHEYLNSTL